MQVIVKIKYRKINHKPRSNLRPAYKTMKVKTMAERRHSHMKIMHTSHTYVNKMKMFNLGLGYRRTLLRYFWFDFVSGSHHNDS